MTEKRLAYTVTEAAQAAGVGKNTMYELVHADRVPAYKSGKRFLIPVRALEEFLNEAAERREQLR